MRTKRNYKDSIFRMLYLDEKELLNLYNAVNGTNYTDVENLETISIMSGIPEGLCTSSTSPFLAPISAAISG